MSKCLLMSKWRFCAVATGDEAAPRDLRRAQPERREGAFPTGITSRGIVRRFY